VQKKKRNKQKCFFQGSFVARDSNQQTIGKAKINVPEDPGYIGTSKWVSEAAICLLESKNNNEENNSVQGGVLTTGSCNAMGYKLINKLSKVNFHIE